MAKSPEHPPQGNVARVRRYRAGLRTDLREISAKLDKLREQVASALTCQAPRPKQSTDRPLK
jgi:hypothetical protein